MKATSFGVRRAMRRLKRIANSYEHELERWTSSLCQVLVNVGDLVCANIDDSIEQHNVDEHAVADLRNLLALLDAIALCCSSRVTTLKTDIACAGKALAAATTRLSDARQRLSMATRGSASDHSVQSSIQRTEKCASHLQTLRHDLKRVKALSTESSRISNLCRMATAVLRQYELARAGLLCNIAQMFCDMATHMRELFTDLVQRLHSILGPNNTDDQTSLVMVGKLQTTIADLEHTATSLRSNSDMSDHIASLQAQIQNGTLRRWLPSAFHTASQSHALPKPQTPSECCHQLASVISDTLRTSAALARAGTDKVNQTPRNAVKLRATIQRASSLVCSSVRRCQTSVSQTFVNGVLRFDAREARQLWRTSMQYSDESDISRSRALAREYSSYVEKFHSAFVEIQDRSQRFVQTMLPALDSLICSTKESSESLKVVDLALQNLHHTVGQAICHLLLDAGAQRKVRNELLTLKLSKDFNKTAPETKTSMSRPHNHSIPHRETLASMLDDHISEKLKLIQQRCIKCGMASAGATLSRVHGLLNILSRDVSSPTTHKSNDFGRKSTPRKKLSPTVRDAVGASRRRSSRSSTSPQNTASESGPMAWAELSRMSLRSVARRFVEMQLADTVHEQGRARPARTSVQRASRTLSSDTPESATEASSAVRVAWEEI